MFLTTPNPKPLSQQLQDKILQYTLLQQKKLKSLPKSKLKSLQQWNIHIPPTLNKTPLQTHQTLPFSQPLPFSQQLSLFLTSLPSHNHHKDLMHQLFHQALNQPLKNLWHLNYTNQLSLAIHLLTKHSKPKSKNLPNLKKKPSDKMQSEKNHNSFVQSQHSDEQDNSGRSPSKRKLRKNNKRVELTPDSKKQPSFSDQDKNSSNSKNPKKSLQLPNEMLDQDNPTTKTMIEEINAEINRVQELYFAEMEQFHTLPYAQADAMLQKTLKPTKIGREITKPQTQNIYSFQEPSNHKFNPHSANNLYPLSNIFSQRLENNPPLHDIHYSNQFFPLINPQINTLGIPYLQVNSQIGQINQQMGQFGHQGIINHQVFGPGNFQNLQNIQNIQNTGFYGQDFMMMNINNYGQAVNGQTQNHNSIKSSQVNGNNSSAKKVILIENIDEDE